ncbi:MAG: bifunctional riboflavin kinase/FAD synthetase [Deltaproteobacteria bacterium]|nr:bifunctional riboflavin kinase/FAD synthetase [Deltaproteobacteria bacterium]
MDILEHSLLSPGQVTRSVITIGNFDGVHLGHRALLARVRERARSLGAASIVYTFHPHPLKVLNPSFCPPQLTCFEDRAALIGAEGIDVLVWARFDREYAAQEPEIFARETLTERLGAAEVWVGPDFAFGRARRGSLEVLRRLGSALGFDLCILEPFTLDGEVVSSTRIRQAVAEADFSTARRLLGRSYSLRGPVVHGAARGQSLGFPTANVLPREECLPMPGVYAAWAVTDGTRHAAAVNVGANPTFGATELTVEAYLLDYAGDLYGAELEIVFVAAVRGEIAFRSPDDLIHQIHRDVDAIRAVLAAQEAHLPTEGP